MNSCVLSGYETRMKYIFLDSSKGGEYADIDIIPEELVFQKTENFPAFFFMGNFAVFATKTGRKFFA